MSKRGGPRNPVGKLSPAAGDLSAVPGKLYFRIGEVAQLCRVPAYVLRFWESEFPRLRPGKSGTGQRLYRRSDVDTALRIKRLLHEDGYTIAGARAVLDAESAVPPHLGLPTLVPTPLPISDPPPLLPGSSAAAPALSDLSAMHLRSRLDQVRTELTDLLTFLRSDPPPPRRSHS